MRIGCCAPVEDISFLKELGFDYVEIPAISSEDVCDEFIKYFNCFLPRDLSIYSPADFSTLKEHAAKVLMTAAANNIAVVTFGSGSTRKIAGKTISLHEKKYWEEFLLYLDACAKKYNVKIALEPLTKKETNFINTPKEAVFWITSLGLSYFGITLDSYHYFSEHDDLLDVLQYKKYVLHAHLADEHQSVPEDLSQKFCDFLYLVRHIGCGLSIEMVPYVREKLSKQLVLMFRQEEKI